MAKKTLVIDDISGETGARTRRFSLDGTEYEIDLTDASFADLRAALKPFMKAGRSVGGGSTGARRAASNGRKPASRRRSSGKAPTEAALIRAWARANGMAVTERGRVAPELRSAWEAAGSPR